mmetsp:Transcript_23224/g.64481  ORF Transcript_23224/g.64481 Transcript_23224/m.64481 type:complete len:211 (+) Transcript_23224:558-1190(+)
MVGRRHLAAECCGYQLCPKANPQDSLLPTVGCHYNRPQRPYPLIRPVSIEHAAGENDPVVLRHSIFVRETPLKRPVQVPLLILCLALQHVDIHLPIATKPADDEVRRVAINKYTVLFACHGLPLLARRELLNRCNQWMTCGDTSSFSGSLVRAHATVRPQYILLATVDNARKASHGKDAGRDAAHPNLSPLAGHHSVATSPRRMDTLTRL